MVNESKVYSLRSIRQSWVLFWFPISFLRTGSHSCIEAWWWGDWGGLIWGCLNQIGSKYGCLNGGVMRVFFIKGCNSPSKGQLQETGLNNRTVSNLGLKMMGFTSIFGHFHVENDDKLVDFRDARNSTHNFMPFHQNFFLPTLSD